MMVVLDHVVVFLISRLVFLVGALGLELTECFCFFHQLVDLSVRADVQLEDAGLSAFQHSSLQKKMSPWQVCQ